MKNDRRKLTRLLALLCCALIVIPLAAACSKAPAAVDITAEPELTSEPTPAQPEPTPAPSPYIPATALSAAEIKSIEEMVALSGPFSAAMLDKDSMLLSLRRYVAIGARGVPEEHPTGVSAVYDYARDPSFVRRDAQDGPYIMKSEAAAAFIFELYGRELPYPDADYFNEALNDWYCQNGEYRLFPQDTDWDIRQSSYTVDTESGVYTLRMQNGSSEPSIFVECKRAYDRWGFTLLSVKDDTGLLYVPVSTPAPMPDAVPPQTLENDPEEEAPVTEKPNSVSPSASPAQEVPTTQTPAETGGSVDSSVLKGRVIGVDPGHQAKADRNMESVAPGSSETKHKVSSGTVGTVTGVREYQINLDVALLLRDMLQASGATVYMTRTGNDVNISNIERAQFFNEHKVELGVRLHCNGSTNAAKHGAFMLVPADKSYPYYAECVKAAKCILQSYGEATGLSTEQGVTYRSDQTGFNWCERPVTNIEMGHLTNSADEALLVDASFQRRMAEGIFKGIVRYFSE